MHSGDRRHPCPRNRGDTYPGRIFILWNVVNPMGSSNGKSTARLTQFPSGHGRSEEAKASDRKVTRIHKWLDRSIDQPERVPTSDW